ncbi:MAG: hypothetical protein AAFU61_06585 [Pseudomonadota bacterium]
MTVTRRESAQARPVVVGAAKIAPFTSKKIVGRAPLNGPGSAVTFEGRNLDGRDGRAKTLEGRIGGRKALKTDDADLGLASPDRAPNGGVGADVLGGERGREGIEDYSRRFDVIDLPHGVSFEDLRLRQSGDDAVVVYGDGDSVMLEGVKARFFWGGEYFV